MLFCGDISVKVCSGTLNFGIIFTPSSPKESLPSPQLLPCSFPGGQGRRSRQGHSAAPPAAAQEPQEFVQPLCCSHRGSGHTSAILNPLQTDLSRMILFSLNLPNSNHSACNFTVQCSNGQGQVGVHGARTEPAGASLC